MSASGDMIYISTSASHLYALHAATGKVAWDTTLWGELMLSDPVLSPNGSTVYLQGWAGTHPAHPKVYGVGASNGTVLWSCVPGKCGSVVKPVVSKDGASMYVADQCGTMYALATGPSPSPSGN